METLSTTESFSYGWLASGKDSFDIDHELRSLQQAADVDVFDFGLPSSNSSALVHADKIFSNGLLLPLHLMTPSSSSSESKSELSKHSDLVLRRWLSLDSHSESFHSRRDRYQPRRSCDNVAQCGVLSLEYSPLTFHSVPSTPASKGSTKPKLPFLRSCARKYLCCLLPLYNKVKGLRLRSPRPAGRTAPKRSMERGRENAIFDLREESSIYEAVLHCKKSVVRPVDDIA